MLLCLAFVLFGCEKEDREEWNDLTSGNFNPMPSWFYGYKVDSPSEFDRHPLINGLSDSTQIVMKEGLILVYNPYIDSDNCGIRVLSYKSLAEEAERLRAEVEDYGSTMAKPMKVNDFDWLAGVKNGKGWIGKADSKTRKTVKEWTDDKEFEQDIKVDLGYGNYKTVFINRISIGSAIKMKNDYILITHAYNSASAYEFALYNLCIVSDDKIVTTPLPHLLDVTCLITPWYKNSFLITHGKDVTCYSLDGKLIDSFEYVSFDDKYFPCSYTDYITINSRSVVRKTMKSVSVTEWDTYYEPLTQIASDAKVTYTLFSSSTNIWGFKVDVVNVDGSKKSFSFKVNVDSGEITD